MKIVCPLQVMLIAVTLAGNITALAAPVNFVFTTPVNTATSQVSLRIGAKVLQIDIPAGKTASEKRDLIFTEIDNNLVPNYTVEKTGTTGLRISDLSKGTKVTFFPGSTGEASDMIETASASTGGCGFQNSAFDPTDAFGNTSQFTCGLLTDLGILEATVMATNLPALDGASIVQALFQELNPFASNFGAMITNGGDFLTFGFDTNLTVGGGGVIFGTTSMSEGVFGSVTVGGVPEPTTLLLVGSALFGLAFSSLHRRTA